MLANDLSSGCSELWVRVAVIFRRDRLPKRLRMPIRQCLAGCGGAGGPASHPELPETVTGAAPWEPSGTAKRGRLDNLAR